MFLVYYISVTTVGTWVTDWTNDGLFGDGWHLFGIGNKQYEEAITDYAVDNIWTEDLIATVEEAADAEVVGAGDILTAIQEEDFGAFDEAYGTYGDALAERGFDISEIVDTAMEEAPDTSEFGVWVPGIPVLVENGLTAINCPDWLLSLINDGIVGRRWCCFGICSADAGAVYIPCVPGSLRLYGTYRICNGQNFPQVWPFWKILYSNADWYRLRCSWRYGIQNH